MTRRLFFSQLLILYSFLGFGQQHAEKIRNTFLDTSSATVLVASHRGSHNVYPENSLNAIEESIRIGVDIVEIDVKVSKDGIPFLLHDRTLDRTTTGSGDPEAFSWQDLQSFFIVDKGKQTLLKIPTLKDALNLAAGKIMIDLDLKTDRVEEVIDVVNETDTERIVLFFDSDYAVLSRVQRANKDFMIMPRANSIAQADTAITLFDPPVVHIDFSFYTPESVQMIRSSDARVWINALGDADKDIRNGKARKALKKLLLHDANVIQTDEPQLLLEALREQGLHP